MKQQIKIKLDYNNHDNRAFATAAASADDDADDVDTFDGSECYYKFVVGGSINDGDNEEQEGEDGGGNDGTVITFFIVGTFWWPIYPNRCHNKLCFQCKLLTKFGIK